ncbi:MAG: hypothetical protein K6F05_06215 [Succinivibrio sp.]|nr:hypothetical protein [Succinivibrio sp.]
MSGPNTNLNVSQHNSALFDQIKGLDDNKSYFLDKTGHIKEATILDRIKNFFKVGGVRTGIKNLLDSMKRSMTNELKASDKTLNTELNSFLERTDKTSLISGSILKGIASNFKAVHADDLVTSHVSQAKNAVNEVIGEFYDENNVNSWKFNTQADGKEIGFKTSTQENKAMLDFLAKAVKPLWEDPELNADEVTANLDSIKNKAREQISSLLHNLCVMKNSDYLGHPNFTEQYLDYAYAKLINVKKDLNPDTMETFKTTTLNNIHLTGEDELKARHFISGTEQNVKNGAYVYAQNNEKIAFFLEAINNLGGGADNIAIKVEDNVSYYLGAQTYDETIAYVYDELTTAPKFLKDLVRKNIGSLLKDGGGNARTLASVQKRIADLKANVQEVDAITNPVVKKAAQYFLLGLSGKTVPSGVITGAVESAKPLGAAFSKLNENSTSADLFKALLDYHEQAYKVIKNSETFKQLNSTADERQALTEFLFEITLKTLPDEQRGKVTALLNSKQAEELDDILYDIGSYNGKSNKRDFYGDLKVDNNVLENEKYQTNFSGLANIIFILSMRAKTMLNTEQQQPKLPQNAGEQPNEELLKANVQSIKYEIYKYCEAVIKKS